MTRKDYKLIAAAIKRAKPAGGHDTGIARVVREMTAALQEDNPKFNPEKFAAACGMEGNYDA